jgi:hypothetical protein
MDGRTDGRTGRQAFKQIDEPRILCTGEVELLSAARNQLLFIPKYMKHSL